MAQEHTDLCEIKATYTTQVNVAQIRFFLVKCRTFFGQAVEVAFKCGPYQMVSDLVMFFCFICILHAIYILS